MVNRYAGKLRGVLNLKAGEKKFQSSLRLPSQDLAFFVEHFWMIKWDLKDQESYLSETLPHPCVHLVFEQDQSRIVGVVKGKFSYLLENKGQVFGIKFKPGAFYPFIHSPVSQFTDRTISIEEALGIESKPLEDAILLEENEEAKIEIANNFLRERLPEQDENIARISQIIDCIITNQEITRVDDVISRLNLNKRMLQRLFRLYVGVSPKWVIKRYRLHEAAERLTNGESVDWSQLAQDLGYFDQAHFIKDFKTIVGKTPAEYAKQNGLDRF